MLDRDKDFGECGSNSYGWKYYQDGRYFNAQGKELDIKGKIVENRAQEAVIAPIESLETKPIPKPRGRRKSPPSTTGAKK